MIAVTANDTGFPAGSLRPNRERKLLSRTPDKSNAVSARAAVPARTTGYLRSLPRAGEQPFLFRRNRGTIPLDAQFEDGNIMPFASYLALSTVANPAQGTVDTTTKEYRDSQAAYYGVSPSNINRFGLPKVLLGGATSTDSTDNTLDVLESLSEKERKAFLALAQKQGFISQDLDVAKLAEDPTGSLSKIAEILDTAGAPSVLQATKTEQSGSDGPPPHEKSTGVNKIALVTVAALLAFFIWKGLSRGRDV